MLPPLRTVFCALLILSLGWRTAPAGEGNVAVSRPGTLHLTLHSAVQMALARNFTIQVEQFNPKIAEENVTRAWGIFDPVLTLGGARRYDSDRGTLNLDGTRSTQSFITRNDELIRSDISGLTPLGTEYRFGFDSIRASSSGRPFDTISSGPVASLAQPLLRGLGPNATMSNIRIARTNVEISEWTLRQRLIDVVTELVYTYNDLHYARENLKVALRSRELANQLLQDNTRRADIGVMSPLDITTARAQVAAREEGVILARASVTDNEMVLKRLVTRELEPMITIAVEIEPPPFSTARLQLHEGLREALELRPDYQSLILSLKNRRITVAFAKNQVLPQLDLVASLGFLGFDEDFLGSIGRIGEADSLNWSAGATFSIPLGNHAARGSLNAARLEAARTLVDLKRLEQQVVVEVDNALRQVNTGTARIASTTEASRLARESLDAGEQRLRAGTGTTFEVLQLQTQLAEAERAELRARADYNKAIAEFYRRTGRTLREQHVEIR